MHASKGNNTETAYENNQYNVSGNYTFQNTATPIRGQLALGNTGYSTDIYFLYFGKRVSSLVSEVNVWAFEATPERWQSLRNSQLISTIAAVNLRSMDGTLNLIGRVIMAHCSDTLVYICLIFNSTVHLKNYAQFQPNHWDGNVILANFVSSCTGSCHDDNFPLSQWWKFRQNDDIS